MSKEYKKVWLGILALLLLGLVAALAVGTGPRVALLLIFLALIPLAALLLREYLIAAAVIIIPLAPHTRLINEQLPSMTLDYPFIALCGLVLLIPALRRWRQARGIWVLAGCWAAFILLAVISWMYTGGSPSDLFTVNRFGYFAAVLVMGAAMDPRTFDLKKLFRVFYGVAFLVAIIGLVQYFFYNHFINELFINAYLRSGMSDYYYYYRIAERVISTFGNPHSAGMFLCVAMLLALGSNYWGFNKTWTRVVWVLVLMMAIILTRSRTTYICLATCYILASLMSHRLNPGKYVGALGFLAVTFGLLVHFLRPNWFINLLNYQGSIQARFAIWEVALERFLSSPVLGAGPNPNIWVKDSFLPTVPVDNLYLTVLASYGLLGMVLLLFTLFWIFRLLVTASRTDFNRARLARGFGLGLVALLIANLSGDLLFHTRIFGSFLLLTGCFLVSALAGGGGPIRVALVGNAASVHLRRWGWALAQKGLVVYILSPEHYPVEGCTVYRIGHQDVTAVSIPGILDAWRRLLRVEKKLADIDPDLVHIQGAFSFGWYATTFTGGPVTASVWGGDIYRYATASWRKRLVVRSILNKADLVTVPTEEVATDVRKKFKIINTVVLPWGIDERVFYPRQKVETEAVRDRLNIPPGAELVLSPRTLSPAYNVAAVVEAIPHVLKAKDNVYFCFLQGCGDAIYREKLQKRAAELGVYDSTKWLEDFLNAEQMACLFSTAGVIISVPDTDNLGSTVVEGLACGSIPVVKNLDNYRPLQRAGAVMYTVTSVRPDSLAAAILTALGAQCERTATVNMAAALSFGTWREAVDRMVELYTGLAAVRFPRGKINDRG